jgi:hypothetical protein
MRRKLLESTPHEGLKDATHIDVEVYYTQGGANYLCGGTTPRGYYVSVKPVKRNGVTVSFVLFSGCKKLLMETKRFSEKQFDKAVELGRAAIPELIAQVLADERAA